MEDFGTCHTDELRERIKLSSNDLQFPETLHVDVIRNHLIERRIVAKDGRQDKEALLRLFRKHVSPLPQRNESLNHLNALNASVKAVSLNRSFSQEHIKFERKRKMENNGESSNSDLTVKIPVGTKTDSRSSRPVKLKRKSYNAGKQNQENSPKCDEKEPLDSPMPSEISSLHASSAAMKSPRESSIVSQHEEKPANESQKRNSRTPISYKTPDSINNNPGHGRGRNKTNFRETNRKVRLSSNAEKNVSSDSTTETDAIKINADHVPTVQCNTTPPTIKLNDGYNDSKQNYEEAPLKETIHISIGTGKMRSTVVVAKEEDGQTESQSVMEQFEAEEHNVFEVDEAKSDKSVFSRLDTTPEKAGEDHTKENSLDGNDGKQSKKILKKKTESDQIQRMTEQQHHRKNRSRSRSHNRNNSRSATRHDNDRQRSPRRRSPPRGGRGRDYRGSDDRRSDGRKFGQLSRIQDARWQGDRGRRRFNSRERQQELRMADRNRPATLSHRRTVREKSHEQPVEHRDNKRRISPTKPETDAKSKLDPSKEKYSEAERKKMEEELKKLDIMIEIQKTKKKTKLHSTSESEVLTNTDNEKLTIESAAINLAIHSNENENTSQDLPEPTAVEKGPEVSQLESKVSEKDDAKVEIPIKHPQQLEPKDVSSIETLVSETSSISHIPINLPEVQEDQAKTGFKKEELQIKESETTTGMNQPTETDCVTMKEQKSSSSDEESSNDVAKRRKKKKRKRKKRKKKETTTESSDSRQSDTEQGIKDDSKLDNDDGDDTQSSKSNKSSSSDDESTKVESEDTSESESSDKSSDGSESSDDSEPVKKKRSKKKKKKKKKKRKEQTESDSEESSDDDSDDESEKTSSRKKRKHKKKKKSKRKHSKKKNKKVEDVVSKEQIALILEKEKKKMKEEILKEIQQRMPDAVLQQKATRENKTEDEGDGLELDYSSEDVDQHGFPTGIPLRKENSEVKEIKPTESQGKKEDVLDVFKSDNDLDYDLDEDEDEANWKRQKKDDEKNKQKTLHDNRRKERSRKDQQRRTDQQDDRLKRPSKDTDRKDVHQRLSRDSSKYDKEVRGKPVEQVKERTDQIDTKSKDDRVRREKPSPRSERRESRPIEPKTERRGSREKQLPDQNEEKSQEVSRKAVLIDSRNSENSESRKAAMIDSKRGAENLDSRKAAISDSNQGNENRKRSPEERPHKEDEKKKRSRFDVTEVSTKTEKLHVPTTTIDQSKATTTPKKENIISSKTFQPFDRDEHPKPKDGIAIAKEVRNDVYKLNDFWNVKPKRLDESTESVFSQQDDYKESELTTAPVEKVNSRATLIKGGHWEAPYSSDKPQTVLTEPSYSDIGSRLLNIAEDTYRQLPNPSSHKQHQEVHSMEKQQRSPVRKNLRGEQVEVQGRINLEQDDSRRYSDAEKSSRRRSVENEQRKREDQNDDNSIRRPDDTYTRSKSRHDERHYSSDNISRSKYEQVNTSNTRDENYRQNSTIRKSRISSRDDDKRHNDRPITISKNLKHGDDSLKRHHKTNNGSNSNGQIAHKNYHADHKNDLSRDYPDTNKRLKKASSSDSNKFPISSSRPDGDSPGPDDDHNMNESLIPEKFTHPKKNYRSVKKR